MRIFNSIDTNIKKYKRSKSFLIPTLVYKKLFKIILNVQLTQRSTELLLKIRDYLFHHSFGLLIIHCFCFVL